MATASDTFQLVADSGFLCSTVEHLREKDPALFAFFHGSKTTSLICQHEGGDYDSVKWPNPVPEHLRAALYDARETGLIPDVKSVLLPDGTSFDVEIAE